MRVLSILLLILVVLSIFVSAKQDIEDKNDKSDNKKEKKQKVKVVELQGKNAYPVKCSALAKGCLCWKCTDDAVLLCRYIC